MSVTKDELKKYLGLIYEVASHDPQLDTPSNREKIWAFAKKIIPAEQQKIIDAAQTPDEKLLTLNLILLKLVQEPDFSLPPDLNELVAQYEKHQTQKEQDLEVKAAHMATTKKSLLDQQLAALKQISKLDSVAQEVATDLVLEPEKTLSILSQILPPEDLAPLIPEMAHPVVENVYLQVFQIIPQPAAAAAVTVLKIAAPQTTVPQIQQLLDRLTLTSEAIGKPLNIPPATAAGISQIQAPSPTTPPLALSLHNQFLKAGYPTSQASALASQFAAQFVPTINLIASFTPHQPADSPQQHTQRVSQVKIYFSNQVVEYLNLRTVYFTRPLQFYSSQPDYSPGQPLTQNQSGWFDYLVGFGKNKIQDKISSMAWERFAASEIGKKVLTSLGAEAAAGAALAPETLGLSLLIPLAIEAAKNLWSKAKIIIKKYLPAVLLGLAGIVGGVVGGLGLVGASALGLTGAVAGTAIQGSGGVAGALTKTGNTITAASTALVSLVATEIAAPVIIIIISIPIGIALILFIINSSALIVPPGLRTAGRAVPGEGGGVCEIAASGYCSPSNFSANFGQQADNASRICNGESIGGRPAIINDGCLREPVSQKRIHTWDYSVGLFQINMLSHPNPAFLKTTAGLSLSNKIAEIGRAGKTCYNAFDSDTVSTPSNLWSTSYCNIIDQELLSTCVSWFKEPVNNIAYADFMSNHGQSWNPWSVARSCGIVQ